MAKSSNVKSETQTQRRVKYGFNITIAIVAAAAIVLILNIISYKYLDRVRLDTTQSRRYSLSDQTRKILNNLENDFRIVTLISESNSYIDNAKDLIEEYQYYSNKVEVEHMSPLAGKSFFNDLLKRFENQLTAIRQGIDHGRKAVEEAEQLLTRQAPLIQAVLNDPQLVNEEHKLFLNQLTRFIGRMAQSRSDISTVVDRSLESVLPDFSGVLSQIRQELDLIDKNIEVSVNNLNNWASTAAMAPSVSNGFLKLKDGLQSVQDAVANSHRILNDVGNADKYDDVRNQLRTPNTVVISSPRDIRIISLQEMFRQPNAEQLAQAQPGDLIDQAFVGEEKITGALVGLELDKQPMVVFVYAGQQPATGPGGDYAHVAQRLETMNFDVRQWNPMGQNRPGFGGPPMPPQPAPEPAEDQRVIWIITPMPPANPMMPTASAGTSQVADMVKQKLDDGHTAMFILGPNPGIAYGAQDPMVDVIEPWGISPQLDRQIYYQEILPDRRTTASPNIMIDQWTGDSAITTALGTMRGVFPVTCPLILTTSGNTSLDHWVLASATHRDMWAETNLQSPNPKYNQSTAANSFTIAVAAKTDKGRIVVVADPFWASNRVTMWGQLGPGTAPLTGAAFPANAELFLNSVYWLADLEELIARSARTQDIRRVGQMSQGGFVAIKVLLLVGLPLAALACGIGVWLRRRTV